MTIRAGTRPVGRLGRLLLGLAVAIQAAACVVNPVTGENEFSLVSEAEELEIGAEHYVPSQQMEGGMYKVDPELQAYVSGVGQKIAAVSDRKLPYEFVVLANPEANAWALPGGKIAVNLGLLWELQDEAELAAVLGHEVVHAAARHGAAGQTRGILLQGALLATALALDGREYADLALGAAWIGGILVDATYSRDQELEADLYGTRYMAHAGYDPQGAVRLQETFVRLSEGGDDFLSRMFASHPPSPERVEKNRQTAAALATAGADGRTVYQQKTARLRKMRPAYEAYGKGVEALQKGDTSAATARAREALRIEPREARFHVLLGDIASKRRDWDKAVEHYDNAVELDPEYYSPWLSRGIAYYKLEDFEAARADLVQSIAYLPSAEAHLHLGRIERRDGNVDAAIGHFEVAAGAESALGKQAQRELLRLDLPRRPGAYLEVTTRINQRGRLIIQVKNPTDIAVSRVAVQLSFDGEDETLTYSDTIGPGETVNIAADDWDLTQEDLASLGTKVLRARVQGQSPRSREDEERPARFGH